MRLSPWCLEVLLGTPRSHAWQFWLLLDPRRWYFSWIKTQPDEANHSTRTHFQAGPLAVNVYWRA